MVISSTLPSIRVWNTNFVSGNVTITALVNDAISQAKLSMRLVLIFFIAWSTDRSECTGYTVLSVSRCTVLTVSGCTVLSVSGCAVLGVSGCL